MSIISKPNTFSTGTSIVAAEHNDNFNTIYNDYNGNITNANISAAAAIAYSKLNLNGNLQLSDFSATVLATIYPVGSIYINAAVSTNPATLLGFGTWVAFGAGKMIIGLDSTDTDFDSLTDTGGAKTHTLDVTEIPADVWRNTGTATVAAGPTGTVNANAGGGQPFSIMNPYVIAYMWRRSA